MGSTRSRLQGCASPTGSAGHRRGFTALHQNGSRARPNSFNSRRTVPLIGSAEISGFSSPLFRRGEGDETIHAGHETIFRL
jgi:hypothetical protein